MQGDRNLNKLCVGGEIVTGTGSVGGHHEPPSGGGSPEFDAIIDSEGEQTILLSVSH